MPRNTNKAATAKARAARKAPSVAEKVMWEMLRNRKAVFKFRREHPIGPYRVDFFCAKAMLAVEMDGEQHEPVADDRRDRYLAERGIMTYRISNRRLFNIGEINFVDDLAEIFRLCSERTGGKAD